MRRTSCTALALTAVLTLSGCTGPTSSPLAVRGCSDVGAPEGVGVDLTTVLPFEGGDYYATTRLPGLGQEATHGFAGNDEHGLSTSVEADLSGDPVDVEVVVVTERGDVAHRASGRLQPHLYQPNGAECDGENYRVDVQATEDGQLVPLPLGGVAKDSRGRISVVVFTEHGVCSVSDAYSSYVRVGGPVDDGAGGPPPGWGVPAQRGWAAIDGDVLTFEDELGHREVFQRAAAEDLPQLCP